MSFSRGELWRRYGEPTDQVGSINEPRTFTEHGVMWNEKWIYRGTNGRAVVRIVLFLRYDLVGIFRIRPDASALPEWLPGADDPG